MVDRGMFYDAFTLVGNALSQTLVTNLGNDTLDGGGGGDILSGSAGDDLYFIRHANDRIDEYNAEGTDTVRSFISFTLADDDSIENLFTDNFFGRMAIDLTGNGFDQTIRGNAASNRLNGLGGNDILDGKAGADFIYGGAGNDRLIGGLGKDLLSGGSGADRFYFTDAPGAANADMVVDFAKGQDSIYLERDVFTGLTGTRLASAAFKDLASGAKDADDRIIFDQGNLYFDIDGSGQADAQLFAQIANGAVMSSADFWLT
jgi:serralysin